jgi:hypothetical protein
MEKENVRTGPGLSRWAAMCAPVLLASLGCGKVPGQFIILDNKAPQANCSVTADPGAASLVSGFMDVSIVNDAALTAYLTIPLMENDLPPPGAGQFVDGNRIALSSFDVDLHLVSNPTHPQDVVDLFQGLEGNQDPLVHFNIPTSGSVPSGGGHSASFVESFPASLARKIRDELHAPQPGSQLQVEIRLSARGSKITGAIQSDDFVFPISVCNGCLVNSVQTCPVKTPPIEKGDPCNVAQDAPVDCCMLGTQLVCPSIVASQ